MDTNGQVVAPPDAREKLVGEPLTLGYQPSLPPWALGFMGGTDVVPQLYLLRDIELMMHHPVVLSSLNYFKGGIAGAEFWGGPSPDGNAQGLPICPTNPEVDAFVQEQCRRYWDRGVPKLQGGYEYGWIGCENLFTDEKGRLEWDDLMQFSPRDTYLLTVNSKPVGVRVKNVNRDYEGEPPPDEQKQRPSGAVDLWLASESVPAKGLWYAHNPRYHQWYGQSQLLGAWRPWRRLGWKKCAEMIIDAAFYRFGYSGCVVKHPNEDQLAPPGTPNTTLDSQGRPRRFARDVARQIGEWYEAGASVTLSSETYPQEQGGGPKWELEIPKNTLSAEGLIAYIKYLIDQVRLGVGVPPELIESGETGSGYSGRQIPLQGFLLVQQRIADALLKLFVDQVLKPLVLWNFGPVVWDVKVKNLLESKQKMLQANRPEMGGSQPATGGQGGMGALQVPPDSTMPNSPMHTPGVSSGPGMPFAVNPLVTDRIREITRKILRSAA